MAWLTRTTSIRKAALPAFWNIRWIGPPYLTDPLPYKGFLLSQLYRDAASGTPWITTVQAARVAQGPFHGRGADVDHKHPGHGCHRDRAGDGTEALRAARAQRPNRDREHQEEQDCRQGESDGFGLHLGAAGSVQSFAVRAEHGCELSAHRCPGSRKQVVSALPYTAFDQSHKGPGCPVAHARGSQHNQ